MIKKYIQQEEVYVKRFGPKTMFLLQCGSFYEVYCCKKNGIFTSNRILEFARICDMTIANKRSKCAGLSVFMSGFPELHLEKYVKKLNDAGWTVAVHCQEPSCPKIRKELGIFSPGTNFETEECGSNRIMTVWIEVYDKTMLNKSPKVSCGIACIDIGSGDVYTFQCIENYFHNPTTFDELERFYCSYKPNELIVIHNCEDKQINDIIAFADIEARLIHKVSLSNTEGEWYKSAINAQKQTYHEEQLTKYYHISDYNVFYETHSLREREMATQCLVFLLNFLDFHNNDLVKQLKLPVFTNIEERVRLANHSLRQLNVIDIGNKSKYSSLMSLVNKCKTPMGRRFLAQKLLNPTTNTDYLKSEYDIIEHTISQYEHEEWKTIPSHLKNITDFERLFRKLILRRIVPSDLAVLFDNIKTIKDIRKIVSNDKKIANYLKYPTLINDLKTLKNKIKDSVNIKVAGKISSCRDFDDNIFNKGVFPELDKAEAAYIQANTKLEAIRQYLASFLSKEKNPIKIHQTEKSGLFLITTKKRFRTLKTLLEDMLCAKVANVKSLEMAKLAAADDAAAALNDDENEEVEVIELTGEQYGADSDEEFRKDFGIVSGVPSITGQATIDIKLIESPLKESRASGNNVRIDNIVITKLYHTIAQTKSNFKDILLSTFNSFVETFLQHKEEFEIIIEFVTKLDFLLTRVNVAISNNYCRPIINNDVEQSFIVAKDIRHPLIEHINTNELYVPNDISLGVDTMHTGIMLFGTNAVGKSSLIRSIGMSVVLAQAGFFVPCSSFIYKPYSSIFTRILGNDDIFKGLSTFAVEMSELSVIIKYAGENSLILGDELCSGTETTSALCIVSAGIELLHNKNASFIFATHFHELTERQELMNLKRLSLQHMVVRYDSQLKTLVYDRKLREGPGNKLYGLEVCKSLSMPPEFLDLANAYRCKYGNQQNVVLNSAESHYNVRKLKTQCEMCGCDATEIHHMLPQKDADERGYIGSAHKNHPANLMSICRNCHDKFTKGNIKHKRVKTSDGMRFDTI